MDAIASMKSFAAITFKALLRLVRAACTISLTLLPLAEVLLRLARSMSAATKSAIPVAPVTGCDGVGELRNACPTKMTSAWERRSSNDATDSECSSCLKHQIISLIYLSLTLLNGDSPRSIQEPMLASFWVCNTAGDALSLGYNLRQALYQNDEHQKEGDCWHTHVQLQFGRVMLNNSEW